MKFIELSKGYKAIVDDEDYEYLMQWKWSYNKYAYRRPMVKRKSWIVRMHRVVVNCPPDKQVDHINGDTLDNRKANLRICTPYQNSLNKKKRNSLNSSSKYIGVTWRGERHNAWRARITLNGKETFIGYFKEERHAAMAYDMWAKELFGEFARTNFQPVP